MSEKKKPARSAKKTPPVVAIVTPAGITGSFNKDQRPLIAHIPVTTAELTFDTSNELKYNPVIPDLVPRPFDDHPSPLSYLEGAEDRPLHGGAIAERTQASLPSLFPGLGTAGTAGTAGIAGTAGAVGAAGATGATVPGVGTKTASNTLGAPVRCRLPVNYSEKLMVLFQDNNRYTKLPDKTDIVCFWCCHGFPTPPIALPSHILDETWHVYGNFCSPECAAAHLFKERLDSHVQWERYALLNTLYSEDAGIKAGSVHGIKPAPPREVLRMFGGSMDISEYRALVHERKLRVDVMTPPMVSIIQTMDTKPMDFYDQNIKNVFTKNDLQHKYDAPGAQGLRLRRSKPVKSKEATVEWAMQIQPATAIMTNILTHS